MKTFGAISAALATASLFASSVFADVDPIVIKGSKFFYSSNGTQFYIKGVAYQQDFAGGGASSGGTTSSGSQYIDPLASAANCQRDIPYLQQLGTNTIRVYALDPTKNHDQCMSMLADAGIYVVADLSAPGASIDRSDPSWNTNLYSRYAAVVDAMAGYSNTLGFFAGNEVANNASYTSSSAFVKAAVRDMKSYIKAKNYRSIGVGYANNDDPETRVNLADYFNCGDASTSVDFWGYNVYSWCGDSTYQQSGWADRVAQFSTYDIPVFFAEYGCNTQGTRTFQEVGTLYSAPMDQTWSGGIVYMYFQEANDYGLVSVSGNTVSKLPDFDNLASQIAAVNPTGVSGASYHPSNGPQACPTEDATWAVAPTNLPPTPNEQVCECMYNALSCKPDNSVNSNNIGKLFGLVCGLSAAACEGIATNASAGQYGVFGMCNPQQQIGWALNDYYSEQTAAGNGASACDFGGSATLTSAAAITGTCASLISQAAGGTGTVTSAPTITGGSSGSSSSATSGSSSSSSSGIAAPMAHFTSVNVGFLQIATYLLVAVGTGAGMILL